MKVVLVLCAYVAFCDSLTLPANFKKCYRKDPNFKQCLYDSVRAAIPQLTRPYKELYIPSMDPLEIEAITLTLGRSSVALTQNLRNCSFSGFSKVRLDTVNVDFDEKTLNMTGVAPEYTIRCQYEVEGKILLLPITGKGRTVVELRDIATSINATYSEVKKRKKTYFKVGTAALDLTPGWAHFDIQNLFNGNEELGNNINRVLNENWKQIFPEVKSDYIKAVLEVGLKIYQQFLSHVSAEEMFD